MKARVTRGPVSRDAGLFLLRTQRQVVSLATYDRRMAVVAEAMAVVTTWRPPAPPGDLPPGKSCSCET
jgi:hypothetical protein